MTKKKLNYGAGEFMNDTDNLPDTAIGAGMAMFDNYTKFDVTTKKLELQRDAKDLITKLIDVYLSTDKIQRPEYVDAIAKVEKMNLATLLGQVRYAEHALDSLMRQLDSGGFTDPATYEMIMRMQSSCIDITLKVANYTRSLPDYFKSLEADITKYQSIDLIQTGKSTLTDTNGNESVVEEFSSGSTFRGTKDLLKMINNAKAMQAEQQIEVDAKLKQLSEADTVAPVYVEDEDFEDVDIDEEAE
jgi:hypothetical protein